MITLNEISLIIAILGGIIGILAHIRIGHLSEDQIEAMATESIKTLYPEIETLIHELKIKEVKNDTPK